MLVSSVLALLPGRALAEACCLLPVGSCADFAPSTCEGLDGISQGAGTTCSGVDCFAPQACCTHWGCSEASPQDCEYGCGSCHSRGPGTACNAATQCLQGACCFPDGSCSMEFEAVCDAWLDGTPVLWLDCASAACPQPEACCFEDGWCQDALPADCVDAGGTPDAGTTCATSTCSLLPPRACCLPDRTCQEETPFDCVALSGDPRDAAATCAGTTCQQPGACCLWDGSCRELAFFACQALVGQPYAPGTPCASSACPQPEACCATDDTCFDVPADTCLWLWGETSRGPGSTCASGACDPPPGWVPDGDGRGGPPLRVTKSDTAGALDLSWGPSCSPADEDYAVYEGTISAWYSHGSVACSTGRRRTATITPGAATPNRYYLVVPNTSIEEGSHGLASFGVERPRGTAPCRTAQGIGCR